MNRLNSSKKRRGNFYNFNFLNSQEVPSLAFLSLKDNNEIKDDIVDVPMSKPKYIIKGKGTDNSRDIQRLRTL